MLNKIEVKKLQEMRDEAEKLASNCYRAFEFYEDDYLKEKAQHFLTISDFCEFLLKNDPKRWNLYNIDFNSCFEYYEEK